MNRLFTSSLIALLGVSYLLSTTVIAGNDACVVPATDKIIPSQASEYWSGDVGMSAGTAMILSKGNSGLQCRPGYIEIHERDAQGSWNQSALFTKSELFSENFSPELQCIDTEGDYALVGAHGNWPVQEGKVSTLYRNSTGVWEQVDVIDAPGEESGHEFGTHIDIQNDKALVASSSGRVYVYQHVFNGSWILTGSLPDSVGTIDDISLFGNSAVVSADGEVTIYSNSSNSWQQDAVLEPDDGGSFGSSVSLQLIQLVVGASDDGSGSAYVFRLQDGTWNQIAKLTPSDGQPGDRFGHDVAYFGTGVMISSPEHDASGESSGAAYFFDQPGFSGPWQEVAKIIAGDGRTDDRFGQVIDFAGNSVIFGGNMDDALSGQAYLLDGLYDDCNGNGGMDLCDISSGLSSDCNNNRIPDDCELIDGTASDCDGNGLLDECESDCNGNGVADACDLTDGTSLDCNANGIPDDCDVDCNANGIPDSCDIVTGSSDDLDGNGVPDECGIPCGTIASDRLTAGTMGGFDQFGSAMALQDHTLMISASPSGPGRGSVHVFTRQQDSNWFETDVLTSSADESITIRQYGSSVEISGDTAFISSRTDDGCGLIDGRVEILERQMDGGWTHVGTLTQGDEFDSDTFGTSIALEDNLAIISDTSFETNPTIYQRHSDGSWPETQTLPDGALVDGYTPYRYGYDMALDGDLLLVQADVSAGSGMNGSQVYAYERQSNGTWNQTAAFRGGKEIEDDDFGHSIDLSNGIALIGASSNAGGASVYQRQADGTWLQQSQLTAPETVVGFGQSVALSGDRAVIGTRSDKAFIFQSQLDGTWIGIDSIRPDEVMDGDRFAEQMTSDDGMIVLGAPGDDDFMEDTGSVYPYAIPVFAVTDDCNANGICDALDISVGISLDVDSDGVPDECGCPDANGDDSIDVNDLLFIIDSWGDCVPDQDCPADVDDDGLVNVNDILLVISEWGDCE